MANKIYRLKQWSENGQKIDPDTRCYVPVVGSYVPAAPESSEKTAGLGDGDTSGRRDSSSLASLPLVRNVPSSQYREKVEKELQKVVSWCLPASPGKVNRKLFRMARCLLGMKMDIALKELAFIFWFDRSMKAGMVNPESKETLLAEFMDCVRRADVPYETPALRAWNQAGWNPFPPEADLFASTPMKQLVGMCRILDADQKGQWFLACSTVGNLMGVTKMQASRYLDSMIKSGILIVTEKNTRRKARYFRYNPIT